MVKTNKIIFAASTELSSRHTEAHNADTYPVHKVGHDYLNSAIELSAFVEIVSDYTEYPALQKILFRQHTKAAESDAIPLVSPFQDNSPEDDAVTIISLSSNEEDLKVVYDAIPNDYFISSDAETIIATPLIDGKPPIPDILSHRLRTSESHPDDIYGEPDAQV
ncbi:hypothetical protein CBL_11585 [Carabus blaptoides fortunei]